jgi:hypothetical protein
MMAWRGAETRRANKLWIKNWRQQLAKVHIEKWHMVKVTLKFKKKSQKTTEF